MTVIGIVLVMFSRKRWRFLQQIVGVHRIHHTRWSMGWAFLFTAWCRFERQIGMDHDFEPPRPRNKPGHWKRCERGSYHDSTASGVY